MCDADVCQALDSNNADAAKNQLSCFSQSLFGGVQGNVPKFGNCGG